ncbi:uncharacterized protein L203_101746 [Cryptococcus depauperatus CBS 7841]|uniref:Zn(2)-C6 fungal-type domain-containing protein n=1 Tax=Cryptococcus depauperatus CBS 7841 TaxID=1295531 RepID=A0AAJ8JQI7_9TREE
MDYRDQYEHLLSQDSKRQDGYDYALPQRKMSYRKVSNLGSPRDYLSQSSLRHDPDEQDRDSIFDYGEEKPFSGQKRPADVESLSSQSAETRSQPKQRTNSASNSTKVSTKKEEAGDNPQPRRAAQACLRCRKQKLKCIGGWPCNRCTKSKNVCDFGRPGMGPPPKLQGDSASSEANARLEQLESNVANLLAGLAGGNAGSFPNNEMLHTFDPVRRRDDMRGGNCGLSFRGSDNGEWNSNFSPPTHVRPIESSQGVGHSTSINTARSSDDPTHHVRFTSLPHRTFHQRVYPRSNFSSNDIGPSPASGSQPESVGNGSIKKNSQGKRQGAERKMTTATGADLDEAPFEPLVLQSGLWENREASRRNSSQLSLSSQSRDDPAPKAYDGRMIRGCDDPINTDIIDLAMAENLFKFFIDHCHLFLPIVNIALDDTFNTIRQSPFLISAMIAVAARFYIKYASRKTEALPFLDPSVPPRLANLAEAHLVNTLLRKQHALSDVQAVMILAAWGLQSGGGGPDAWIVTGHAARIARRLGVHKVLGQAAEVARTNPVGSEEFKKLEVLMPQWRTWLCWFCFDGFLSLSFGRPQSTQFETVDETGFLETRLHQVLPHPGTISSLSLHSDVYVAGQVQLTQIGLDLINWGEMTAMFRDKEITVKTMFVELNTKLDNWSKLWVYAGSPYSLYLGSSARIARLQGDYMRLCINSFALKSCPEKNEYIAECLKKALNSAMATIQTHYESSQTDLALSFATDYLTITLSQAAIFLVRIAKAESSVQSIINIEPSVIAHYLKLSINLLRLGELSETRLSTYLAKTICDIASAAGIPSLGTPESEEYESRPQSANSTSNGSNFAQQTQPVNENAPPPDTTFDMDSLLQYEWQTDLSHLLSLPGDIPPAMPQVQPHGMLEGRIYNEFAFPMSEVAMGYGPVSSLPC